MNETTLDKVVGLGLSLAGLLFIGWQHPSDGVLLLAGLCVLGGLTTVVNAQKLGGLVTTIQKADATLKPFIAALASPSSEPPSDPSAKDTGAKATDQGQGSPK